MKSTVNRTHFLLLIFLIVLSFLFGALLWNKNGLSEDSFSYLRGAETLFSQGSYLSMSGEPQIVFPPGYSFFIALFNLIFHNSIFSAKAISLISSSICIFIIFKLGERLFDKKVALLGATLFLFLPLRVFSSLWVLSDTVYVMWIYLALYYLIKKENFNRGYLIVGICLGLAYLIRPEAIYYLVLFTCYLLLDKVNFKQRILNGFMVVIPFSLFLVTYIVYLHSITGDWRWSGKTGDLILALYRSKGIPEEIIRSLSFTGTVCFADIVKLFFHNLSNFKESLLYTIGIAPLAQFLLLFGIFDMLFSMKSRMKLTILQILFISVLFVYAFFWIERRFLLPAMPLFCLWYSNGIVSFYHWSKDKMVNFELANTKKYSLLISVLICVTLIASSSFRILSVENLTSYKTVRVIKHLTEWINENQIQKQSIYSNHDEVAYFTGMNNYYIVAGDMEDIFNVMKDKKITYLIFTSTDFIFPGLELLKNENNAQTDKYFKLIKKVTVDNETAWFYEIL